MVLQRAETPTPEAHKYAGTDPYGDFERQLAMLGGRLDPDLGNNPVVVNVITWERDVKRFEAEDIFQTPAFH